MWPQGDRSLANESTELLMLRLPTQLRSIKCYITGYVVRL
uniref:Uncharacterized protein n=1 Tax=Anguilla anguilla TaxID=7936 RepID=A0A0E9TV37_ANGAN